MNSPESLQPFNRHSQAKSIACDLELFVRRDRPQGLRMLKILEELKDENLLDVEILRVKELFRNELKDIGDGFDENCWKMLTVLELFDNETAVHCIDTYLIAKGKIEKKLWNGIVLVDEFKKEEVSPSQFYRACLLHDIGKIEVPHSVLVNHVTDEKCAEILFKNKEGLILDVLKKKFGEDYKFPDNFNNPEELLKYLHNELHIRPQSLTPIKFLLDGPITDEIISQLEHCGCSVEDSLLKIMRTHDEYSKKILSNFGFVVEGEIAGSHHRQKEDNVKYTITIGTVEVTIDLADIVHLADVENAMVSNRHYHEGKTPIYALKILSLHSKQGFIKNSYIAYIWIADEMNRIKKDGVQEGDKDNYDFLVNFLEEEYTKNPSWPDWKI